MKQNKSGIQIVGVRTVVIIAVLVVMTALVAASIVYFLEPQITSLEKEAKNIKNDNNRLRNEIDEMPSLLEQYKKDETTYDDMIRSGFLGAQDRIVARKIIDYIRKHSGVTGVEYQFSPLISFPDEQRTMALDNELVMTKMDFTVKSVLDIETYGFMQMVDEIFPGKLVLRELEMNRADMVLDEADLKEIGSGKPKAFMNTDVKYEWYTLSEKPEAY